MRYPERVGFKLMLAIPKQKSTGRQEHRRIASQFDIPGAVCRFY